jgi:hypothetical protein
MAPPSSDWRESTTFESRCPHTAQRTSETYRAQADRLP